MSSKSMYLMKNRELNFHFSRKVRMNSIVYRNNIKTRRHKSVKETSSSSSKVSTYFKKTEPKDDSSTHIAQTVCLSFSLRRLTSHLDQMTVHPN